MKSVLDERTSENINRDGLGDFVRCNNCGRFMLVNMGEEICPFCKTETLRWADSEYQEVYDTTLINIGYVISNWDD